MEQIQFISNSKRIITAIGLDISSEAIKLSKEMLAKYNCSAEYLNFNGKDCTRSQ